MFGGALVVEAAAEDDAGNVLLDPCCGAGTLPIEAEISNADGKLKPLAAADEDNGMWAVFDIAVDAERREWKER